MDAFFSLLLIFTPLLTLAGFYRLWRLLTRKYKFKNTTIAVVYVSSIFLAMLGFIYYGGYFLRCVWPGQCGEGFASGYIAAGVILGVLVTTAVYIISEVILFVAVEKRNDDDIA